MYETLETTFMHLLIQTAFVPLEYGTLRPFKRNILGHTKSTTDINYNLTSKK